MITMCSGGANGGGYIPTPGVLVAVALGLYVVSGVVNTFNIQVQVSNPHPHSFLMRVVWRR